MCSGVSVLWEKATMVFVACGNSPQYGMEHEAVGFVQALNYSVFEGAIQSGNVDLFLIAVIAGPEEIT